MKSRSTKYHAKSKDDGSKKGSASNAGYDEQNEVTSKSPKKNPAPTAKEEKVQSAVTKKSNE